jgi:hypothetical protein
MHGLRYSRFMSDSPVNLTRSGPPETVLDDESVSVMSAIDRAQAAGEPARRAALAAVVAENPTSLFAWAALGENTDDIVEAYAYFRVGYHRGLDRLRQSGWRGSGYVRWVHPSNRGFLRSLAGLATSAEAIGETAEAQRCTLFLHQLDPAWPPTLG